MTSGRSALAQKASPPHGGDFPLDYLPVLFYTKEPLPCSTLAGKGQQLKLCGKEQGATRCLTDGCVVRRCGADTDQSLPKRGPEAE